MVIEDKEKMFKALMKKIPGLKKASSLAEQSFIRTPFEPFNQLAKGFPRGKFTVTAGPSGTGKTTLALQTIAYQQSINKDFIAIYVDIEQTLDIEWLKKLGVDLDRMYIVDYMHQKDKRKEAQEFDVEQFDSDAEAFTMEWYLDQIIGLIKYDFADMIIVDSVGAMSPKQEKEKSVGEDTMMLVPKKLNIFFRKATGLLGKTKTAVVLVSHIYSVPNTSVPVENVKGGNPLKFFASLRILHRRSSGESAKMEKVKVQCPDGITREIAQGWNCRLKLDKSKINENESQEIEIPFYRGTGFDSKRTTILSAFAFGLIELKGAWVYSDFILDEAGNPTKLQGKESAINYFLSNETQREKLFTAIREKAIQDDPSIIEEQEELEES